MFDFIVVISLIGGIFFSFFKNKKSTLVNLDIFKSIDNDIVVQNKHN